MDKEYNLYKKKYELYDSLFAENSIDGILSVAESYLNNPIFILDTSYRIITRSNLAKSENSSIETHNGENYLLSDTINLMKETKCIDNIYKIATSFFHYDDQNLIFCSIRINNVTIAYIGVLQSKRGFLDEDLELTNVLSKVLSLQLNKENQFISDSGLDEEYYLMDLLANKIDNIDYVTNRLNSTNFSLNSNLLILSIPFKQKYNDYRHNFGLKELIKTFKNLFGNCISTYYKDNIVFLLSSEYEHVIHDNTKEQLSDFLKLNNLLCGVSIVFTNLLHIQDYFNQSIYALKLSSHMKIYKSINYFEDYSDYYLLYMASNTNADNDLYKLNIITLVNPCIKKLIKYDEDNKTELLKTLKTYFECNRNANDTSGRLNIHRSTLFYRFNKIQSLLNISLDDSNNLFKLELSFKIINYMDQQVMI